MPLQGQALTEVHGPSGPAPAERSLGELKSARDRAQGFSQEETDPQTKCRVGWIDLRLHSIHAVERFDEAGAEEVHIAGDTHFLQCRSRE